MFGKNQKFINKKRKKLKKLKKIKMKINKWNKEMWISKQKFNIPT
jgi:hypothetical protein